MSKAEIYLFSFLKSIKLPPTDHVLGTSFNESRDFLNRLDFD